MITTGENTYALPSKEEGRGASPDIVVEGSG
jgi:hypothetical protein